MSKDDIVKNLKELIFQNLNIPTEYIKEDDDLIHNSEFDFDSIDEYELVSDIDACYGTNLKGTAREKLKTVNMIADEVIKQMYDGKSK